MSLKEKSVSATSKMTCRVMGHRWHKEISPPIQLDPNGGIEFSYKTCLRCLHEDYFKRSVGTSKWLPATKEDSERVRKFIADVDQWMKDLDKLTDETYETLLDYIDETTKGQA